MATNETGQTRWGWGWGWEGWKLPKVLLERLQPPDSVNWNK